MSRLKIKPVLYRKEWEWAYITQALWENGFLKKGSRGLCFGVGREPLPALFASMECEIMATDLDINCGASMEWEEGNQHAGGNIQLLNDQQICPDELFVKNVHYQNVDMNTIPSNLRNFDFNWSSCALEHIGSIQKSMDFIVNQLDTLRSGGLAVHTTEFNLSSDSKTLDDPLTCILRKRDILEVADKLEKLGHYVYPLDLRRGRLAGDRFVDVVPFKQYPVHLRLVLVAWVTTSIGLIIQKKQSDD
jgi:hypothetical protein